MIFLIIFLSCLMVAIGVGALAAFSDLRSMTIPNSYSVVVLVAFLVAYFGHWVLGGGVFSVPYSHLLAAGIIFVVTFVMFALKTIGAADSKLATVFALWVGLKGLFAFLFYMTLVGGLLGVVALALRHWKPFKVPPEGSWVAQVQAGAGKVPYGVAIFIGGLVSFAKLGYFSVELYVSLL